MDRQTDLSDCGQASAVEFLGLSAWTAKALAFEQIETVADLAQRSEADLIAVLPRKSVKEIKDRFAEKGLSLAGAG